MVEHHLHAAVSSFAICHKTVEMLIQKGAKINAKDLSGITPLHLAVSYGWNLGIRILLKNGANIEAKTNFGRRPMHFVVDSTFQCEKTMEILIQNSAKLDVKDANGDTPLHLATLHGRSSIVDILLTNGASLKIRNQDGLTSLECALKRNALLMNHNLKHTKVLFYSGVVM